MEMQNEIKNDGKIEAIKRMCICKGCPSYFDCSKQGGIRELAFCLKSIGKSKCISKDKGCTCPGCPVHMKLNFKKRLYCIKGSEMSQKSNTLG